MIRHHVAVLNRSHLADLEVGTTTGALQKQVRQFADAWGIMAGLKPIKRNDMVGWKGAWNIVILDNITEADALGYHELTPEGLPVGFIGLDECDADGVTWSSVASHEILEMLADPYINLNSIDARGWLYAYESCDAVEGDSYKLDGIEVSDFVYPTWFCPDLSEGQAKFNQLDSVTRPFQLAEGGYMPVKKPGDGWTQIWGHQARPHADTNAARPHSHTRRYRRLTLPRGDWRRSDD